MMTLVVARKLTECHIEIVSDMRVTDLNDAGRKLFKSGALKAVVISRSRCICYAGNLHRALHTLESLFQKKLEDPPTETLIDFLLKAHSEGNRDTDFILCELGEKAHIHAIRDLAHADVEMIWLGDHGAFSTYQEYLAANINKSETSDLRQPMRLAMMVLIQNSSRNSHPTVGEHAIAVTSTEHGFMYCFYSLGFPVTLEKGEKTAKNDAPRGGYAESILVPKSPGIGAVAVHFFPGNVGVLYYPKLAMAPVVTRNVNTAQFRAHLMDSTDVEFTGFDNSYITTSIQGGPQ